MAERFPNGTTYVGWWSADADGVYLSDGFGAQYTAASDGGWTFTGFYSQNERQGFGEIIFTAEERKKSMIQELNGRVVGFWNQDRLHGPAFKYYPKGSPHYRGVQDQESAHVSFLWFARGRETEGSEVWVKDEFPSLHEKILKDVESLNTFKIPAKHENGPQKLLKCAVEKVEAKFRNVTEILCEHMLGLASDGQHVPLSEKLQKFAQDHEEYFGSKNATSLLAAMSRSPAVYVDASSTKPTPEVTATDAKEKAQTAPEVIDIRGTLDIRTSKKSLNAKSKCEAVKKPAKPKKKQASKSEKRKKRAAPIAKKSEDKTHTKRAKHTACSSGVAKPSSREAAPAARAEPDNQQRFQQMLRFVNKLFAGEHEKLTLNTIRIMVEKSFSAKEIQSLLPRVLYTLDSSNRVMVVVHRL